MGFLGRLQHSQELAALGRGRAERSHGTRGLGLESGARCCPSPASTRFSSPTAKSGHLPRPGRRENSFSSMGPTAHLSRCSKVATDNACVDGGGCVPKKLCFQRAGGEQTRREPSCARLERGFPRAQFSPASSLPRKVSAGAGEQAPRLPPSPSWGPRAPWDRATLTMS